LCRATLRSAWQIVSQTACSAETKEAPQMRGLFHRAGGLLSALALLAGDCAVADVVAIEMPVPFDARCQSVSILLGCANRVAHGSGTQHAAACRGDFAITQSGACMKYLAFQLCGGIQAPDHGALVVFAGITAG